LIGLSPLPSTHPKTFQRLLVRSSRSCYGSFNLVKGRSPGFASTATDSSPCSDSLSLRLRAWMHLTLPVTVTRRLIMQKARRHQNTSSDRLQAYGFRFFSPPDLGYFSPFPRGTGSLSVSWEYLALADGAAEFRQGFSNPALLRIPAHLTTLSRKGLSPAMVDFPKSFWSGS
jgi:hypothetical protein